MFCSFFLNPGWEQSAGWSLGLATLLLVSSPSRSPDFSDVAIVKGSGAKGPSLSFSLVLSNL